MSQVGDVSVSQILTCGFEELIHDETEVNTNIYTIVLETISAVFSKQRLGVRLVVYLIILTWHLYKTFWLPRKKLFFVP